MLFQAMKRELANAKVEAGELAGGHSTLPDIVSAIKSNLRELQNEKQLVRRELGASDLDREAWSVVELVAALKSELRETKDELGSVSRELKSSIKRGGEADNEHMTVVGQAAEQRALLQETEMVLDTAQREREVREGRFCSAR